MNIIASYKIILLIGLYIFLFCYLYKYTSFFQYKESFTVTWTPYVGDVYNQPGYSNYFYHNNYMYPVY
jgi:hypothetical protein